LTWRWAFAKKPVALLRRLPPLAALVLCMWGGSARAVDSLGVPLPNGAEPLGPGRFHSPQSLDATIEYMERQFRQSGLRVRFEPSIDLPDVASAHASAPNEKTRWAGINVSEYGGKVVIFIIERS
jgi:hypothetical protein